MVLVYRFGRLDAACGGGKHPWRLHTQRAHIIEFLHTQILAEIRGDICLAIGALRDHRAQPGWGQSRCGIVDGEAAPEDQAIVMVNDRAAHAVLVVLG